MVYVSNIWVLLGETYNTAILLIFYVLVVYNHPRKILLEFQIKRCFRHALIYINIYFTHTQPLY